MCDERTGETHNYTRRHGVEYSKIVVPKGSPEWAYESASLWNKVEGSENRKNSTVAREFEVALPHELNPQQRINLADAITNNLVDRFGFACQYSIHKPDDENSKNHHVHILASTRKLEATGFTEKTRELDEMKQTKEQDSNPAVLEVRKMVADTINQHLQQAQIKAKVDHRSINAQYQEAVKNNDAVKMVELSREPTKHIGKKPDEANRAVIQNKAIKQLHQNNINVVTGIIDRLSKPANQNQPAVKKSEPTIFAKLIDGIMEKYMSMKKAKADKLELAEKHKHEQERIKEEKFDLERAQAYEKGVAKLRAEVSAKQNHSFNSNGLDSKRQAPEPSPVGSLFEQQQESLAPTPSRKLKM